MSRTWLLAGLIVVVLTGSCSRHYEPTILPTPPGAKDVRSLPFLDGSGHETLFFLNVKYPSTVVIEHYTKLIDRPWYRCVWGGDQWASHLDATGVNGKAGAPRTVHSNGRLWVNPQARRTLVLVLSYYSIPGSIVPVDDSQQVILAEYFSKNIKAEIQRLSLQCPPEVYAAL